MKKWKETKFAWLQEQNVQFVMLMAAEAVTYLVL